MREVTICGRRFRLDPEGVRLAVAGELPEPLHEHYVVIEGRRFPPKQVIAAATGLDRADFTTHQARRILTRLGFPAARRAAATGAAPAQSGGGPHGGRQADALRPFVGRWVATSGLEILVAADSPSAVVAWLSRHGRQADSLFRVPEDETSAGGAAPA